MLPAEVIVVNGEVDREGTSDRGTGNGDHLQYLLSAASYDWWALSVVEDGSARRASDMVNRIRWGRGHEGKRCRVKGDVNLAGETIEDPVVVKNVTFTGKVDFSECRFERGVDLTGCRFEGGLILKDACIEGPLILDKMVIGTMIHRIIASLDEGRRRARSDRSEPREERIQKVRRRIRRRRSQQCWRKQSVAEFTNLRVAGRLSMMEASVFGDLSCNHAEIEDDFRIDQTRIYGDLLLRRTSLGEVCTDWKKRYLNADTTVGCRVDGRLDLTSAKVNGDVRLIGVDIGGELTLQATDIDGNLLCRANEQLRTRLRNGAWLRGVHVKGTVDLGGTWLHGGLDLITADISGNLACSTSGKWFFTMDGDAQLDGAKIAGDADFQGANFEGKLSLQNTSIGGTLFCRATQDLEKNLPCKIAKDAWLLGAVVAGDVDISGAHIGGQLSMQNARVGQNLLARTMGSLRTEIEGGAWLLGVTVAGAVDLSGTHIVGDLTMESAEVRSIVARFMGDFPTQIEGNADLNEGNADLSGVRVFRSAEFFGTIIQGDLALDGASIDGDLMVAFDLNDADNWKAKNSRVGGEIHAKSAKIGKRVILAGLNAGSTRREGNASAEGKRKNSTPMIEEHTVDFAGAHINGKFLLRSKVLVKEHLQSKKPEFVVKEISDDRKAELLEQPCLSQTKIQGNLRLTRANMFGDIVLDAGIIEGKLDLRDANVQANINCTPIDVGSSWEPIIGFSREPIRASVYEVDLETLDTVGDINLTGLDITGLDINGDSKLDGDLNLRGARVRGRLELFPLGQEKPTDDPASEPKATAAQESNHSKPFA